ncbi:Imm43 family immunity protein [Photorhabdus luminescens]|nr:Imm43 family immunity protein [Photorhabdus luminescens]
MNDYNSSLMPRYPHAIVDTEKKINEKWDYEGSRHDMPYYLLDKECPNTLYLLCNKNIGKLGFNYYQHNMDCVLSDRFFYIINEFKLSVSVLKKLISTSIKYRSLIPHKLSFHNESLNYDIFSIRTTLLAGFIFISEKVANKFSKENIKRIKPIKLDEVFNHYCVDFRYGIKTNIKKGKIKLP